MSSSTEEDTFNENYKYFANLTSVKSALGIIPTNDAHDGTLDHVIARANDTITNILSKYMDTPVPDGILIPKCRHAAQVLALSMWHRHNHQDTHASEYQTEYDEVRMSIETYLKARRNDKTKTVLSTGTGPLEERIRLPSQRDTFVLD